MATTTTTTTTTKTYSRNEDNHGLASLQLEASHSPPPGNVFPAMERWNHPKSNIYKIAATFWAFLVMGANDAAYGVSLLLRIYIHSI
jgi:hypothetical protein